jgi:hypothetical protein
MNDPELHVLLEAVSDEASFLQFARRLEKDRRDSIREEALHPSSPYGPDARGWENISIEAFLESAIAWAEDSEFGRTQGLASASPWRLMANFLYAGKFYE